MKKKIYCMMLVFCFIFTFLFTGVTVSAASLEESNVLDDLSRDTSFKSGYYIDNASITDFQVIQIAESDAQRLFIYTVKPSGDAFKDLKLQKILLYDDVAISPGSFTPKLYDLEFCNSEGIFDKYVVKNYELPSEAYRYYNIVSIYRTYSFSVDSASENTTVGGVANLKAVAVGQQWECYIYNDVYSCKMNTFEVLQLTNLYTDTIKVDGGIDVLQWLGFENKGYINIVCFNAEEYQIKHIYDADISYNYACDWAVYRPDGSYDSGTTFEEKSKTLTDTEELTYKDKTEFLAKEYKWKTILKTSDFVKNMKDSDVEFDSDSENEILNRQWCFAFEVTEDTSSNVVQPNIGTTRNTWHYYVSDVSILRIKFLDFSNRIYNLGCVSDMVTSDDIPGGVGDGIDISDIFNSDDGSLFKKAMQIIFFVLGVVLIFTFLPVLMPIISFIVSFIVNAITFIVKLFIKIITAPFRLIGGKGRDKKP